ncbi:MAG: carboxy terminal-processing peptidase [Sideroxyarcus sp.]|nr:carboxy terminal-processing peptidase [Sideroxyarcus sp.]
MKTRLLWVLLAYSLTAQAATLDATPPVPQLVPLQEQAKAAHLSFEVLSRYHYRRMPLNDDASSKIFDNFLQSLDGEKVFFSQADVDQFAASRTGLDDAILGEKLDIPFSMYQVYLQRITERLTYARSLLKRGFEFKSRESYQYNREAAPWPKSEAELNEIWRKRVKSDWLRLKLAGKDDKSIAETLDKRYANTLSSISKAKSEDVFHLFMDAYATAIDPHTGYFGVRASEEFDISMKLSLVGIGAVLQDKDEYTIIKELLAGSPAALSGKLNVGDRIVGVGQGENSVPTEVMGWRIEDTVALIRGEEDSVVLLDVLPAEAAPDGKHKQVTLVRKKISLEKQSAKKSIIERKLGAATYRVGVISLPGFYQDFAARQNGDKDYKSATRDVARLLEELKADKVDSVLVDLRNNGGGSLVEAIELTGLFIDRGPVVQQRDSKGTVSVESDSKAGVAWNGPLGVLINRGSASASEIFAAAIQDYGRGIVIGNRSFGKGTVQSVVDLDFLASNPQPVYGELKMTIAQFFRVNGGTTQLHGVTPDIALPTVMDAEEFGESSFDNALPWTSIPAADFMPAGDLTAILPKLTASHKARIAKDKEFQYIREDIAEFKAQRKKNLISLNEAERRKERAKLEARLQLRENGGRAPAGKTAGKQAASPGHALQDDGLMSSERDTNADLAIEKARDDAKDVFLNEAAHILGDASALLQSSPRLASRVLPARAIR